jgi:hypothetical protein
VQATSVHAKHASSARNAHRHRAAACQYTDIANAPGNLLIYLRGLQLCEVQMLRCMRANLMALLHSSQGSSLRMQ